MKYISEAVQRSQEKKSMEECSLVEQILRKHGDPRLAEILALDLLLVGIDTV